MSYYPWQESIWQQLYQQFQQQQLPHALLFYGAEGLGKSNFARTFGQLLLCEHGDEKGSPCGTCRYCALVEAGNHPDYLILEPEEAGKMIKVDDVRQMIGKIDKTAQLGQYKVLIIDGAEALNVNASNALLKTLEEPTDHTIIMLVTPQLMQLSATIRSRCQKIAFHAPATSVAKEWLASKSIPLDDVDLLLQLANKAPLRVLSLLDEDYLSERKTRFNSFLAFMKEERGLVDLSKEWSNIDLSLLIEQLTSWIEDIIRLLSQGESGVTNIDFSLALKQLAEKQSLHRWFVAYDLLIRAQKIVSKKIALNSQLLIENILLSLKRDYVS